MLLSSWRRNYIQVDIEVTEENMWIDLTRSYRVSKIKKVIVWLIIAIQQ